MTDHKGPDYELDDNLVIDRPDQYRALFEPTRARIVDLVMDRAATIKELADTLAKPKGTVGYHVSVLAGAGLIRVVRTKRVRAIVAKYYGRTARTFELVGVAGVDIGLSPAHFLTEAAAEYALAGSNEIEPHEMTFSTLRRVRVPDERAAEWSNRLQELALEFVSEPRGGETTFGLVMALYPTDRAHLPKGERD